MTTELHNELIALLDQCHLQLGNAAIGEESKKLLEYYATRIESAYREAGYVDASNLLKASDLIAKQAKVLLDMSETNLKSTLLGITKGEEQ